MIKLIASDLDGTILQNGAQVVDPELIETVNQLIRNGIYFVAASGRTYNNIKLLFQDVTEPMIIIGENGGMYAYNNTTYVPNYHTREFVEAFVRTVREDPDCQLSYSCENTTYVEHTDKEFGDRLAQVIRYDITFVDDFLALDTLPIKLAIRNAKGIEHSEQKYRDLFGDQVNVITSGNLWLDFMPFSSNKGKALEHITAMLNIAPEECIAFGDQQNDAEMLSFVGTSYAMTNAVPCIAEISTHTTDSVLKELKKYL